MITKFFLNYSEMMTQLLVMKIEADCNYKYKGNDYFYSKDNFQWDYANAIIQFSKIVALI